MTIIKGEPIIFRNLDRSPTQRVLDEVRQQLISDARESNNLTDFAFAHLAHAYLGTGDFSMQMVGRDYEMQSVMQALASAKNDEASDDAEVIQMMLEKCNGFPVSEITANVLLKRVRRSDTSYSTRALVSLPPSADFRNIVFPPEVRQSNAPLLFFHPIQRCTKHALDDLYKEHRDVVFQIPYRAPDQIQSTLKRDPQTGVVEYVMRTPQGDEKQDPELFLLGGVQQALGNDPISMLVSEFLSRNNVTYFNHEG